MLYVFSFFPVCVEPLVFVFLPVFLFPVFLLPVLLQSRVK